MICNISHRKSLRYILVEFLLIYKTVFYTNLLIQELGRSNGKNEAIFLYCLQSNGKNGVRLYEFFLNDAHFMHFISF